MKTPTGTPPADSQTYTVPSEHHLSLELLGKVHALERGAVQEMRAQADQRERAATQDMLRGLERILRGPCGAEVPKGVALDFDVQAHTITVVRPRPLATARQGVQAIPPGTSQAEGATSSASPPA